MGGAKYCGRAVTSIRHLELAVSGTCQRLTALEDDQRLALLTVKRTSTALYATLGLRPEMQIDAV